VLNLYGLTVIEL
jgi:ribonuclease H2 subunit A